MKNTKMNILTIIVTPCSYSGGAENAAVALSAELAKGKNYNITLMTMASENGNIKKEGIVVKKVKSIIPFMIPRPYRNAIILPGNLLQEIRKDKYDIVHIHNTHPAIAMAQIARKCVEEGIPYVVSTHGVVEAAIIKNTYKNNPLVKLFSNVLINKSLDYVLSNADKIAALTEYEIPILKEFKVQKKNINVVYNGVDANMYEKQEKQINIRKKFNVNKTEKIVLFVGVIKENKGIDVLLKSANLLQNCKVIIAGGGEQKEYKEYLLAIVKKLKLEDKVIFTGFVDNKTLTALYQQCDIFALPTKADTLPLCILDAMASKKPVVSTRVGGIPEEVGKENGILVEPNNHVALAKSIQKLIESDTLRKSMGQNGYKKIAKKFTWDKVATKVSKLYQEIATQKN